MPATQEPIVRRPRAAEASIVVVDNKGRERTQHVEYVVSDVRGETVYITAEGLAYARDSLTRKSRFDLIDEFARLPAVLAYPDIVVFDYASPADTLIYYKRIYLRSEHEYELVAVIVKLRQGVKFLYNFHSQESGKVKGAREAETIAVWYIAPGKRPREFGL